MLVEPRQLRRAARRCKAAGAARASSVRRGGAVEQRGGVRRGAMGSERQRHSRVREAERQRHDRFTGMSVREIWKSTRSPKFESSANPGSGTGLASRKTTSFAPVQSAVWFTTRNAGMCDVRVGSFQTPPVLRLRITALSTPTGIRTLDTGTLTPLSLHRRQKCSRKAFFVFGGSASHPSSPPEMASPQHISLKWWRLRFGDSVDAVLARSVASSIATGGSQHDWGSLACHSAISRISPLFGL